MKHCFLTKAILHLHLRGCRKFGNTESFRQRDRQGPNQGLKCYKCQQIGHFVKNCPLNRRQGHSSIAEHDCKQQDDSIALNSSTTCRNRDIRWYIDSGATKHMTFEKDLIVDFYEYEQPSKIYLSLVTTEQLKLLEKER